MRVVDFFAGAGGWSLGAVQAGCTVVLAVNHNALACESHRANIGGDVAREDLFRLDAARIPRADVWCKSPACTGHTQARGREKAHHDEARATAWCGVRLLSEMSPSKRPAVVLVENVPAFRRWDADPKSKRKEGRLFLAWWSAMEACGYTGHLHCIDSADLGVPQRRKRLFMTFARGRRPFVLGDPRALGLPRRVARDVVDLDAGEWARWESYAPRSVARIRDAAAYRRAESFVVSYYSAKSSHRGASLDAPFGTLTTKDRHLVVRGDRSRVLLVGEQLAAMGFPRDYVLAGNRTDQVRQIGNAVCPPVSRWIVEEVMRRG